MGSSRSILPRTVRAASQSSCICFARILVGKGAIAAKQRDELELDILAIQVAVEVEQIGLEHRRAVAEGRARPDIASGGVAAPLDVDAHGIDALRHVLAFGERKVQRRKAESLAAAVARLDRAA